MFKQLLIILAIILYSSISFGQAPKYSNEFLSIGVGARALGLSNSCIASVDDVTAGYWNPASLCNIKSDIQVALMHSDYFSGLAKYDYAAVAAKIDNKSAFGASFIRFGVDDIPNTSELIDKDGNVDYDRIKTFSAADYGFLFSYSRLSNIKGLRFGANAKIIHRKVGDFAKAWGFGLDAALNYEYKKWIFAVVAKDVTSTFNAWSYNLSNEMKEVFTITGNEIPKNSLELTVPRLIFGTSRKININEDITVYPELNFDITFDGKRNVMVKSNVASIDPHLGLEFAYKNFIYVRGGIGNIQKETNYDGLVETTFQPNVGLGVRIKNFSIDYALTNIGNQSIAPYSNVFSIKLNITKKEQTATPSL
ncbi:MAG: PorV/PorQ family protein [Bacteroidota bacterium]